LLIDAGNRPRGSNGARGGAGRAVVITCVTMAACWVIKTIRFGYSVYMDLSDTVCRTRHQVLTKCTDRAWIITHSIIGRARRRPVGIQDPTTRIKADLTIVHTRIVNLVKCDIRACCGAACLKQSYECGKRERGEFENSAISCMHICPWGSSPLWRAVYIQRAADESLFSIANLG